MDTNNQNRSWKVLCWNVRGLNAERKWSTIRDKILECQADIVCLQETKKDLFDRAFIRKICASDFDAFEFLPSIGASGGVITIWKSRFFDGNLIYSNEFGISVEFKSTLDYATWILTNAYGTCTSEGKRNFVHWLKNIQMPDDREWLIVGDFNLI